MTDQRTTPHDATPHRLLVRLLRSSGQDMPSADSLSSYTPRVEPADVVTPDPGGDAVFDNAAADVSGGGAGAAVAVGHDSASARREPEATAALELLRREHDELVSYCRRSSADLQAMTSDRDSARELLAAAVAERDRDLGGTRAELAAAKAELAATRSKLARATAELRRTHADMAPVSRSQVARADEQLAALNATIDKLAGRVCVPVLGSARSSRRG